MIRAPLPSWPLLVPAVVFLALAPPARATWLPDGIAVATPAGDRFEPRAVPDGAGGALIFWRGPGTAGHMRGQRVDADGNRLWSDGGVSVCATTGAMTHLSVCPDGTHGAVIAWEDARSGRPDVYAQRVNGPGSTLWTTNGLSVSATTGYERNPSVLADETSGGFLMAWEDSMPPGHGTTIAAQRFDGNGTRIWNAFAVEVTSGTSVKAGVRMTGDGVGTTAKGTVLSWVDFAGGPSGDIYAGRVSDSGVVQWTLSGVPVCTATGVQTDARIENVGGDKVVVAWEDRRTGGSQIYAQELDSAGNRLWTTNGVAVCLPGLVQTLPEIAPDGEGGSFLFWREIRGGLSLIFGQRLDASGVAQWATDGVALATQGGAVGLRPGVVGDGAGGCIVSWIDGRNGGSDLYGQRIDANGNLRWSSEGVLVGTSSMTDPDPSIVADGSQGILATWQRGNDAYMTRIPAASSSVDVPVLDPAGFLVAIASGNPSRHGAELAVRLTRDAAVSLDVYDVAGRRVRRVEEGRMLSAGSHRLLWDGDDDSNRPVAPGTYFLRTRADGRGETRRIVIVR